MIRESEFVWREDGRVVHKYRRDTGEYVLTAPRLINDSYLGWTRVRLGGGPWDGVSVAREPGEVLWVQGHRYDLSDGRYLGEIE